MPCSTLNIDNPLRREDSLVLLEPDLRQDDNIKCRAKSQSLRNFSQIVLEQHRKSDSGSPTRTPILKHHYTYSPEQDEFTMSSPMPYNSFPPTMAHDPLPEIRTYPHSPTQDLLTSHNDYATSHHTAYGGTYCRSDIQHIPCPHVPATYDPDAMPRSAPPAPGNKQGRNKNRRKKDKSRNKKKRTRAIASSQGNKNSGDAPTIRRKQRTNETRPTITREANWHPVDTRCHENKQGLGNCRSFEDYVRDIRHARGTYHWTNTGHTPPMAILSRSTTSIAFSGPGYVLSPTVLSPSGGAQISSRFSRRPAADKTKYDCMSNTDDMQALADSLTKLPSIPCNSNPEITSESQHSQLHKSSSNPEIVKPNQQMTAHTVRRISTSNMTSSSDDIPPPNPPKRVNSSATRGASTVPQTHSDPPEGDKKRRQVALLVAIKPENQEAERDKFFKLKYNYDPQFAYRFPPNQGALERFARPAKKLLNVATKIMNHVINKYGSFETFVERTGGKKLNRSQIVEAAKKYLKKEKLSEEVSVRLSDDMLSRACMTRIRGQPTLQVRVNDIQEFWMDGLLRHEIGTHYIRSSNNRCQEWHKWRRRRDLKLRPYNPTEEGIAALHSIIRRPEPSMFRSALLYYTVYMASELSFAELFKNLGRFVKDPQVRWDYCMRAKRGQTDTSQPGTFSKDQVYLTGAMSILKHREDIDFHALFKCGKVDFRDVERIKELADLDNTRIPGFMVDLQQYKRHLEDIVVKNGLTDDDLSVAV